MNLYSDLRVPLPEIGRGLPCSAFSTYTGTGTWRLVREMVPDVDRRYAAPIRGDEDGERTLSPADTA